MQPFLVYHPRNTAYQGYSQKQSPEKFKETKLYIAEPDTSLCQVVQDGNNTKSRLATLLRGCGRERQAGTHPCETIRYPIRHSRCVWVDARLASRQIQTQNR